jgi:hypothetical protein
MNGNVKRLPVERQPSSYPHDVRLMNLVGPGQTVFFERVIDGFGKRLFQVREKCDAAPFLDLVPESVLFERENRATEHRL